MCVSGKRAIGIKEMKGRDRSLRSAEKVSQSLTIMEEKIGRASQSMFRARTERKKKTREEIFYF